MVHFLLYSHHAATKSGITSYIFTLYVYSVWLLGGVWSIDVVIDLLPGQMSSDGNSWNGYTFESTAPKSGKEQVTTNTSKANKEIGSINN